MIYTPEWLFYDLSPEDFFSIQVDCAVTVPHLVGPWVWGDVFCFACTKKRGRRELLIQNTFYFIFFLKLKETLFFFRNTWKHKKRSTLCMGGFGCVCELRSKSACICRGSNFYIRLAYIKLWSQRQMHNAQHGTQSFSFQWTQSVLSQLWMEESLCCTSWNVVEVHQCIEHVWQHSLSQECSPTTHRGTQTTAAPVRQDRYILLYGVVSPRFGDPWDCPVYCYTCVNQHCQCMLQ